MASSTKKKFSSRLSGMKFMQRGRNKPPSSGVAESKTDDDNNQQALGGGSGGVKPSSKNGMASKPIVVREADPLPRGRTTGRLSFGKKRANMETVEVLDGPGYEPPSSDGAAGKRKNDGRMNEELFVRPGGAGDVKKFTKRPKTSDRRRDLGGVEGAGRPEADAAGG